MHLVGGFPVPAINPTFLAWATLCAVSQIAAACATADKPLHVVVGQDDLGQAAARAAGIASVVEAGTLPALREAGRRLAAT